MGIGKEVAQPLLDVIGKRITKPLGIFVEEAVPKMDIPTLVRLSKEEPPKFDTWLKRTNDYVNGEQGGGLEAANLVDEARAAHQEIDLKGQVLAQKHHDPLAPPEQPVLNTTTGINKADKKWADEWVASEKGQEFLAGRKAKLEELNVRRQEIKERTALGFDPDDPAKFSNERRPIKADKKLVRESRDKTSTAQAEVIREDISHPAAADKGYGIKEAKTIPDRKASEGFAPSNKDLETGLTYEEMLEQHHLLFNAEGSALFSQKIFDDDPGFMVALQRYVAKKYDSAFGEAAHNMANIPQIQVHRPYHKWLRDLKLDGISGSNYEQFWKQKFKENPNMTAQEIQDAVDEWFEEIIYPSIVMLDDWMSKNISFPRELLKQARASIKNQMNTIKPTAKPGTTAYDVQLDDIHTRAERGEFGPGQRSWFTDSKARKDAMNVIQSQE